jgi:hypothetical protein
MFPVTNLGLYLKEDSTNPIDPLDMFVKPSYNHKLLQKNPVLIPGRVKAAIHRLWHLISCNVHESWRSHGLTWTHQTFQTVRRDYTFLFQPDKKRGQELHPKGMAAPGTPDM